MHSSFHAELVNMSQLNGEEYYSGEMDTINESERGVESVIGFHGEAHHSDSVDSVAKVHSLSQPNVQINTPPKFKHCPACNPKSLKVVRGAGKKSSGKKTKGKKTKSTGKKSGKSKKGGSKSGSKSKAKSGKGKGKGTKKSPKKKKPSGKSKK